MSSLRVGHVTNANLGEARLTMENGARIRTMMVVQCLVLLLIGAVAVAAMKIVADDVRSLSERMVQQSKLAAVAERLQTDLVAAVHEANAATPSWVELEQNLRSANDALEANWEDLMMAFSGDPEKLEGVREAFAKLAPIVAAKSRARLSLFVSDDLSRLVSPATDALLKGGSSQQLDASAAMGSVAERIEQFFYLLLALVVGGIVLSLLLGMSRSAASKRGVMAPT